MKVTTVKDEVPNLLKQIKALMKTEVLVGIPDENAGRRPDGEEAEPISNAEIGYVQEFGMPEKNIPPRPFLIPGVRDAKDKIAKSMEAGARGALTGKADATDVAMNKAGMIASSVVKTKINEGPFVPLAPRTLAERKARGRTGEKPLIDTGQLRNSVTYVIRPKGDVKGK